MVNSPVFVKATNINVDLLRGSHFKAYAYEDEQMRDGVGRIGAHVDHAFTLLLQDNTGGLEVYESI